MLNRSKILCALAAIMVFAATQPVVASILGTQSVINAIGVGENSLADTSGDYLVNGASGQYGNTIVQTGSILLASFQMDTNSVNNGPIIGIGPGNESGYDEMTGFVAVQVTGGNGTSASPWTFGPATSSADLTLIGAVSKAATTAMSSWATGTMIGVYGISAGTAYSRSGVNGSLTDLNNDLATAVIGVGTQVGTALWQFGFTGAGGSAVNGEGWQATAVSNDIAVIGTTAKNISGGLVDYSLDQTVTTPYSSIVQSDQQSAFNPSVMTIQLDGSSNLLGIGSTVAHPVTSPFQAFDNADVTLDITAVPEPASLSLWLGAFIVGGLLLRRRLRIS